MNVWGCKGQLVRFQSGFSEEETDAEVATKLHSVVDATDWPNLGYLKADSFKELPEAKRRRETCQLEIETLEALSHFLIANYA